MFCLFQDIDFTGKSRLRARIVYAVDTEKHVNFIAAGLDHVKNKQIQPLGQFVATQNGRSLWWADYDGNVDSRRKIIESFENTGLENLFDKHEIW